MDPLVEKIARAVLYEGFILYPYRASSKKNQTRFTFGRVYPRSYSAAQDGAEPFVMRTECLAKADAVGISVRFLHPLSREINAPEPVAELRVEGKLHQSWQEAVEREIAIPRVPLDAAPQRISFSFPASRTVEPLGAAGTIVRRQEALEGEVEIASEAAGAGLFKVSVQIANHTPVPESLLENQREIVLRTFASTHTILQAEGGGGFVSLMDPPPDCAGAAAACRNIGTWPVLAGEKGKSATMLSSPIILYDYPEIAPESAGDLCDGAEIDEILTLRIKTMTDEEKSEMRGVDDFARRILDRTESLPDEHLLKMHGLMRETKTAPFKTGDRVRIRPKSRADAMDMALAGRIAIIEAVEQDAEDKIHLALVVEDDPGRDLGMLRQPGHRFFYGTDEVESLREGE